MSWFKFGFKQNFEQVLYKAINDIKTLSIDEIDSMIIKSKNKFPNLFNYKPELNISKRQFEIYQALLLVSVGFIQNSINRELNSSEINTTDSFIYDFVINNSKFNMVGDDFILSAITKSYTQNAILQTHVSWSEIINFSQRKNFNIYQDECSSVILVNGEECLARIHLTKKTKYSAGTLTEHTYTVFNTVNYKKFNEMNERMMSEDYDFDEDRDFRKTIYYDG